MTPRTSRRAWTRATVLTGVGALVLALAPVVPASALPAPPSFSYLDLSTANRVLAAAAADGSGAVNLTPATGLQTYAYDVSWDGNSIVLAGRSGTPTTNVYDSTFGLVYEHRNADASVSSTLLSVFWEANPVITPDGSAAFWIAAGTLYRYTAATGRTTAVSTAFAPARGEVVARLAVNQDGSRVAVMYSNATAKTGRVLAAPVATGKTGNYAEVRYAGAVLPSGSTLVWTALDTVLWDEYVSSAATPVLSPVYLTLTGSGVQSTADLNRGATGLSGYYDVRQVAAGSWFGWNDEVAAGQSTLAGFADPLTSPPSVIGPRSNGSSTFRYVPSLVEPPALQTVGNPAAAHPYLFLSAGSTTYGKRVGYDAHSFYGAPPTAAFTNATAAEVDRGLLQWSFDGVHFTPVLTTSGAKAIIIGSRYYNAYSPALTRNTWFRWVYPGDVFTAAGTSATRAVQVPALVTARVSASGASRTVYGATSRRVAGTAVLFHVVGTKLVKVAVARITATGGYTFGKRRLARGSYRVVTLADRYWASGYRVLSL